MNMIVLVIIGFNLLANNRLKLTRLYGDACIILIIITRYIREIVRDRYTSYEIKNEK